MAPIKPHWVQPSHPDVQEVIVVNETEFTTKSISKVALPPFALFAKLEFPPCTMAAVPTYATVQMGRDKHLDLNSDLLYINHSCEPSLIFDTANMNVIVGPKGIQPGDELTFFYPSTEWYMAQPFDCLCGTSTCRGRIAGARDMTLEQLDGLWLNGHIRELLTEREEQNKKNAKLQQNGNSNGSVTNGSGVKTSENGANGTANDTTSANHNAQNGHLDLSHFSMGAEQTVQALRDALSHAEKVVDAARLALVSYVEALQVAGLGTAPARKLNGSTPAASSNGTTVYDAVKPASEAAPAGAQRRGPTSRELSGEMGGDTSARN